MDCIFLDVNRIIFKDHGKVGPRVSFFTAGHPTDAEVRIQDFEFCFPIVVEDNVWIGGNSTIGPGLTMGKNAIVATGAVVKKRVPACTIVAGNPARVLRQIGEADKSQWQAARTAYFTGENT